MKRLPFLMIAIFLFGFGCNQVKKPSGSVNTNSDMSSNNYIAEVDERLNEVNFSETGNITDWDEVTESYVDDWKLTYEVPGSPAIAVNLILDEDSICVVANEEYICREILNKEFNGKRLYVQGVRDGDEVSVKRITF